MPRAGADHPGEPGRHEDPADPRPRRGRLDGRGDGGHRVDPPGAPADRRHDERCHHRHGAGEQRRRQAVEHDQPGDRHGDEVGDGADEREPAEDEDARDGDAGLGTDRHGHRHRQRTQPVQAPGEPRADAGDAGRRPDGQPEPDGPGEQRVDEEQHDDSHGQRAHRLALAAEGVGGGSQRGHHPGAQDRRLGTRQHDEPADERHGQRPPPERPGPGQERPGGSQEQCHVLAGHRRQVGQSAVAEPLHHLRRLVAVVADHEAPGQRGAVGREHGHAAFDEAADAVRRHGDRVAGADVAEPCGLERPDDVLPGHAPSPVGVEGDALAADQHLLARPPGVDPPTPSPPAHPELVALALDLQDHPARPGVALGLVDHLRPAVVRAEPVRRQAVP